MQDYHRLFFALWPTAQQRGLVVARTAVEVAALRGRPMAADNLHVTLAFIGSVAAVRVPEIWTLASQINFSGCDLVFDKFATWSQPRVAVLKASRTPEALLQLVNALQTQLALADFQLDARAYQPHVTVARDVHADDSEQAVAPITWSSQEFVLVESIRTSSGVQYLVRARFPDQICRTQA